MIRRPPRSTLTDTRFPYPTLFRSVLRDFGRHPVVAHAGDFSVPAMAQADEPPRDRQDRKSTRLNSSHYCASRMPSSALNINNSTYHKLNCYPLLLSQLRHLIAALEQSVSRTRDSFSHYHSTP